MNQRFWGLTTKQVRELAYEFAVKNELEHPFKPNAAGKDWLCGFMQRHPQLAVREAEPTSINRISSFTPNTVSAFFELLKCALTRQKYSAHRIFNIDETGVQSVPRKLPKVIARRGQNKSAK
jgi:hypothetical protein